MDFHKAFGMRLLLLVPIAFCIFIVLDSQDKTWRLAAVVALIMLEQLREWLMMSSIRSLADLAERREARDGKQSFPDLKKGKDNKK